MLRGSQKDGARLLICSEIGSEGRNFQFVQNLVLFDLPDDAELLEQRIGRLDRIGQKGTIQIHIPYLLGGEGEILARWYHEGLGAFERNPPQEEMMRIFTDELAQLSSAHSLEGLSDFLQRVRIKHEELDHQMETGRDRLLELASHNPENSARIAETIRQADLDSGAEQLLLDVLDIHDVSVDELGRRTYSIDNRRFSGESFQDCHGIFLWARLIVISHWHERTCTCSAPTILCLMVHWSFLLPVGLATVVLVSGRQMKTPAYFSNSLCPGTNGSIPSGRWSLPSANSSTYPRRPHWRNAGGGSSSSKVWKSANPHRKTSRSKKPTTQMLASAEKHAETQARGIQATAAANMRRKIQSEIDRLLALKR